MGAYEASLSPALHVRAAMLGLRVAKAGARRMARVLGAQRTAQMRAAAAGAMALSVEESVARAAWIVRGTEPRTDAAARGGDAAARGGDAPAVVQVIGSLAAGGAEPVGMPPDEFGKALHREIEKWAKVVKASGMKMD